jgi:hypothetical protein
LTEHDRYSVSAAREKLRRNTSHSSLRRSKVS